MVPVHRRRRPFDRSYGWKLNSILRSFPRSWEAVETNSCTGYGNPPWKFHGRALYQLNLVKSDVARAFVPEELRLVEAFGYTLGGFFLASYADSPAGVFDELVVLAGLVQGQPKFSAWAAKVLVNSSEACVHGKKIFGLPSSVARFSKSTTTSVSLPKSKINGLLSMIGIGCPTSLPAFHVDTEVTQVCSPDEVDNFFAVKMMAPESEVHSEQWIGPSVRISLPSLSGLTEHNFDLLKYTCDIQSRVRIVKPLHVSEIRSASDPEGQQYAQQNSLGCRDYTAEEPIDLRSLSLSIMQSKPILAMEFNNMTMNVEAPLLA